MPARIDFGRREITVAVPRPTPDHDLRVVLHRELDTALDALLAQDEKAGQPQGLGRLADDEGSDP